jgi:hypothetical protein
MSRTAAVSVRLRPVFLGFGDLQAVEAVTFMGNARQVAAVCIHAPSFSIPDPALEEGRQTEPGFIDFAWRLIWQSETGKIPKEYKCALVDYLLN